MRSPERAPHEHADRPPHPPEIDAARDRGSSRRRTRRSRGEEPAARRGHPPARAHPRRSHPRAGGAGGLRASGARAPAGGGLPPQARRQGRARTRPPAEGPVGRPDGERDPRLQLLLAPGQPRRGPPPRAPPPAPRAPGPPPGGVAGELPGEAAQGRPRRPGDRQGAAAGLHLPGADRASDRGAAQEHPRRRARDRRLRRRARRAARQRRAAGQRGGHPRPRHPAVADAHAAHRQADGGRRDRKRAELVSDHLPPADPGALPRTRAGAGRSPGAGLPAHGALGGRRSRRQPQRRCRHAAPGAAAPGRGGAWPLPRAGAPARRRAVDVGPAGAAERRAAEACRSLTGPQRAPPGRALPARADRHLRAAGGHAAGAHRAAGAARHAAAGAGGAAALRRRRGLRCRSGGGGAVAARAPWRKPRRGAAGAAAARGAGLRLSPCHGRPAAELGQARGGDRRAAARGAPGARLRRAARARALSAAAGAAGRRPAAARARGRLLAAAAERAGHRRGGDTARWPSATTSSATPRR